MTEYERAVGQRLEAVKAKPHARILAIETSCDETAAAVIEDGRRVLSNVVHTQIPLHIPYGGVVPEIASRSHVQKIGSVVRHALEEAGVSLAELDAVAVTNGPGLVGALLVGLTANYIGFLAPKVALGSNILLMALILLWRPQGLYPVAKR